ncbi:hypothetical protein GGS26DRAFT_67224 [Hypomontagnella submonticulosa]|nr:hypothetical protein GGS26DRAFT_67224 [Hypomontagnella submonticulosa]
MIVDSILFLTAARNYCLMKGVASINSTGTNSLPSLSTYNEWPTGGPDSATLRRCTAKELVGYFQYLLDTEEIYWFTLWECIKDGIVSGAVPPTVVDVFLTVCAEPGAVAQVLF